MWSGGAGSSPEELFNDLIANYLIYRPNKIDFINSAHSWFRLHNLILFDFSSPNQSKQCLQPICLQLIVTTL